MGNSASAPTSLFPPTNNHQPGGLFPSSNQPLSSHPSLIARCGETHYEGNGGDCGTFGDVLEAGAAEARLNDHDSPGPIGDAINSIVNDRDVNWNVAPSELTGETHDSSNCPNGK